MFPGHYQPRVPKDLGYYDLRVKEVAEQQSEMALESGVTGFMYWHYWFGKGKVIMDMPIKQMLNNKNVKIKFSVCWANHSWFAKNWNSSDSKTDKLLIEQQYLGKQDYIDYFNYCLPLFNNSSLIIQ